MEESFKLQIISPEKIIFSDNIKMATVPSYEGDMSILKKHIPIITFLRPGIILIKNNENSFVKFFAEDGTVDFFNDTLVILSASALNIKDLSKDFIDNLNKKTQEKLAEKNITDDERYILNHKLETIKEIRI